MDCRKFILVATLLWLMAGSHAWADSADSEDAKESEPGSWLARISGTARDVVACAQSAVSETLDGAVSTVEEALLDSSVDELVYDTTADMRDMVSLAVDDVVKVVEGTVWDPLQGMWGGEGAMVPDTVTMPMGYTASVVSATSTAAGIATDIVPEARDYLLVQVGGAQATIKELKTIDIDGAVISVATICYDHVLVPVDDVGGFIADSYAYAATGLTSTVLEPVSGMVTGTLATTLVSWEDSGIGNRVGEVVSDAADQTMQVIDTTGEWVDTAVPQFAVIEDVDLDQKVSVVTGLIAGGMAGTRTRVIRAAVGGANTWDSLSAATKRQFQRRGLRNGMASRTDDMARVLYETVPQSVRDSGEEAVKEFLGKYELSHIKSIRDFPELADKLDNVIWEDGGLNRRRGANTMEPDEIRAAQEALEQEELLARSKLARKFGLKSLGRGLVWGAIAEVPIVSLENLLHVHHGRMTPEEALRDGVGDTAWNLGMGAAASGAAYLGGHALSSVGVTATVGAAAATPVMVGGAVLYGGYAVYRLCRAAQPEPQEPLYPNGLALAR